MANLYNIYLKLSNGIVKSKPGKAVLNTLYPLVKPIISKMNTFYICTDDFMWLQKYDFIPPKIALRYMVLEEYYGKKTEGISAVDVYVRMKTRSYSNMGGEEYLNDFYKLIQTYEKEGYNPKYAMNVDKDLTVRNGQHRTALALYLGISHITVNRTNQTIPIDFKKQEWESHDISDGENEIINRKAQEILDMCNKPLNIILNAEPNDAFADRLAPLGTVIDRVKLCDAKTANRIAKLYNSGEISGEDIYLVRFKLNKPEYLPLTDPRVPVFRATNKLKELICQGGADGKNQAVQCLVPQNFSQNGYADTVLKENL